MKKIKLMPFVFLFCLIFSVVIIFTTVKDRPFENMVVNNESLNEFNSGWRVFRNGIFMEQIDLPGKVEAEKNDLITIKNTIPINFGENRTIIFRTAQCNIKVFTNGDLTYSYGFLEGDTIKRPVGSAWQIVRIPNSALGKEISIELVSPYSNYVGNLNSVFIGTKAAGIFYIIKQGIVGVSISFLLLVIGLAFLFISIVLHKFIDNRKLFYLGQFSVLASVWAMTETKFLQLFIGDIPIITYTAFLTLNLLPISYLLYLSTYDSYKDDKDIKRLFILCVSNFVMVNILQVFNISDYVNTLILTHIVLIFSIAIIILKFVIDLMRGNKKKEVVIINSSMVVLLGFSCIDLFSFYFIREYQVGIFFQVGLALFIIELSVWGIWQFTQTYSAKVENEALKKLAYIDILTKLANRTAFEHTMDKYRKNEEYSSIFVAVVDINNLKLINDSFGHVMGDNAIILIAQVLIETFKGIGTCYRIGGDEFCIMGNEIPKDKLESLFKKAGANLVENSRKRVYNISIAYGYAYYKAGIGEIDGVFIDADEAMYRCKDELKKDSILYSRDWVQKKY